jgi:hypothetical protein
VGGPCHLHERGGSDAHAIRNTLGAGEAPEVAVQRGLELGIFHGQVTQAEPLQEAHAQHGLVLATGEAAAINATSSHIGTTSSISSRNTALHVRLVLKCSPGSACFFMK